MGKNNLSRLTLLVASSARKLEIAPLESVMTELSSFKRVCRNCKKERNKVTTINKKYILKYTIYCIALPFTLHSVAVSRKTKKKGNYQN